MFKLLTAISGSAFEHSAAESVSQSSDGASAVFRFLNVLLPYLFLYVIGSLAFWLPGAFIASSVVAKWKKHQRKEERENIKEVFAANSNRISNEIRRLELVPNVNLRFNDTEACVECRYIYDEPCGTVYLAYNGGGLIDPPKVAPAFFTKKLDVDKIVGVYVDVGYFNDKNGVNAPAPNAEGGHFCAYYALNIQTLYPDEPVISLPLIRYAPCLVTGHIYAQAQAFAQNVQANIAAIINSRNNG